MNRFLILSLSVVFLAAAPPDRSKIDQHYAEGQKLFGEKTFETALEEFKQVDVLVPDEPQVYSWIAACLNELGRYPEAKDRVEGAFNLLKDAQAKAAEKKQPVLPIDFGYYTLLSRIQMNLREFEAAVTTLDGYPFEDDGSEGAAKTKQAIEAARQALRAKLVAVGAECVRTGDLGCTRTTLTQADRVYAAKPPAREAVARDAMARAEKAPATTDEEKAKKAELFAVAVQANRLWLEDAGSGAREAQRVLADALAGTKKKESYEEAIRILTALWAESPAEQAGKDSSIQLDLAVAHAGLEQWDLAASSASAFIELDRDDPLGQGYCMRSFSQFQQGNCDQALADGQNCKNADGTVRALKYLDTCRQRLAKQEADRAAVAAVRQAKVEQQCAHLYQRVKWARSFIDEISLEDLVKIVEDYKARERECTTYFETAGNGSGNGFSCPTPELCAAGAKTASSPLNLSQRSLEEIESLRKRTKDFLTLCGPSLDPAQAGGVQGGLAKLDQALERPR